MKTLVTSLCLFVSVATAQSQHDERLSAIDTTYSELVYAQETINGQPVTELRSGRHKFRVIESIEEHDGLQIIHLTYDDRPYTLTLAADTTAATILQRDKKVMASIHQKNVRINNKTYVFKKINNAEFSYSLHNQVVMHGKALITDNAYNIYGQYLDFKEYQHENQEVLIILASFYTTGIIDRIVKRKKSFFYKLGKVLGY